MMQVRPLHDRAAWDAFLSQHPQAHYFHSWHWHQLLRGSKQFHCFALAAWHHEQMLGLIPIVINRQGWGRLAASTAIHNCAGPLIRHDLGAAGAADVICHFMDAVENYLHQQHIMHWQVNCRAMPPQIEVLSAWATRRGYTIGHGEGMQLCLAQHSLAQVQAAYHHGFRDALRQAGQHDLEVVPATGYTAQIYQLYSSTMQAVAKPVSYPHSFIAQVVADPGCHGAVVLQNKQVQAFALFLGDQQRYVYWLGGAQRSKARPMQLVLDHLLSRIMQQQCYELDLGGAETQGLKHFKQSMGGQSYAVMSMRKVLRPRALRALGWVELQLQRCLRTVPALGRHLDAPKLLRYF